ncbi:copper chaperone PCu(A)C [Streptomyces boninensis]|uniref:copper chaperone PCu(A)C n=1 Tax=Streptomyces boninensis TaxID=2039455 RepID=UPI003B22444F
MTSPTGPVRRWADRALPALCACAAAALTLAGLTAWTATGAAGRPAQLHIENARLLLPFEGNQTTAALFHIRNTGDADDRLTAVTSPSTGRAMLARDSGTDGGASDGMEMVASADVPAGGELVMSPYGLDVMVDLRSGLRSGLRAGQSIPFVLHFEDSGRIETEAVVVRPGAWRSGR